MKGRWDVLRWNVVLVAEEAMARWIAGAVWEERVERSAGTPGRGVLLLKSGCWAWTFAVQVS